MGGSAKTEGGTAVNQTVPVAEATIDEAVLPERVQEALGQLVGAAKEGLERTLAGVSTRQYRRAQEPVGPEVETDARSTSKSAVSRTFVHRTRQLLWNLMNRPLADLRLAVIMLDGIELHGRTNIVALGITTRDRRHAVCYIVCNWPVANADSCRC